MLQFLRCGYCICIVLHMCINVFYYVKTLLSHRIILYFLDPKEFENQYWPYEFTFYSYNANLVFNYFYYFL